MYRNSDGNATRTKKDDINLKVLNTEVANVVKFPKLGANYNFHSRIQNITALFMCHPSLK